jgi:pyruvate,orthophosphate dikinase
VRLLAPPHHEFLPQSEGQISAMARDMGRRFVELRANVNLLHETNPMLGLSGCRLGTTYPDIY